LPCHAFVHVLFQLFLHFHNSLLIQITSKNHGIFCILIMSLSSFLSFILIIFMIIGY
jgi:hypothetical protein